jgi:hypothetical protein
MIRKNFFLKKKYVISLLVFICLSWVIVDSPYHLVPVGCSLFIIFSYRKRTIGWKENLKNDGSVILSPVAGEVVEVSDFFHNEEAIKYSKIRIIVRFSDYWGLHLPFSAEMEYLKGHRGQLLPRKDLATFDLSKIDDMTKTDLILRSKYGLMTKLTFIHSRFGKSPKIWMKSGDRGRGAACFGYYPFGGSLIIYIPKPCDVLIIKGEQLVPGHTVLAVTKKVEED